MEIVTSFDHLPKKRMAFTIGTFDGLHLGHQAIFSTLLSQKKPTCAVTFIDHPMKTLRPDKVPLQITPLPLKLLLLKTDFCLLLDFKEVVDLHYDEFLSRLGASHIVMGKGDALGKGRLGTESNLRAWGLRNKVQVEYIEKLPNISSTEVRKAIQAADFAYAEKLLGRPHLLYASSQTFSGTDLVLPPDGIYPLYGNECTIENGIITLKNPIAKSVYSFNPNKEFHV